MSADATPAAPEPSTDARPGERSGCRRADRPDSPAGAAHRDHRRAPRRDDEAGAARSTRRRGLTERERAILAFEQQWWRHAGAKEQAVRDTFGISSTRYYQLLNGLLDNPAALAADPRADRPAPPVALVARPQPPPLTASSPRDLALTVADSSPFLRRCRHTPSQDRSRPWPDGSNRMRTDQAGRREAFRGRHATPDPGRERGMTATNQSGRATAGPPGSLPGRPAGRAGRGQVAHAAAEQGGQVAARGAATRPSS